MSSIVAASGRRHAVTRSMRAILCGLVVAMLGGCSDCDTDDVDWGPLYHRDFFVTGSSGDLPFPHAKRRPHKMLLRLEANQVIFVYEDGQKPTQEVWKVVKLYRNWGPH